MKPKTQNNTRQKPRTQNIAFVNDKTANATTIQYKHTD